MKRILFSGLALALVLAGVAPVAAQTTDSTSTRNPYRYTYRNGRSLRVNWEPETAKTFRRYTVAITPTMLFNHGLKFDFEAEMRPGEWLQTGLVGYISPRRCTPNPYSFYSDNYQRYLPSGGVWGDGLDRMWGAGASILFKKFFHRRGWYFATGLVVEYFSVERTVYGFSEFRQDGLTMYERGYHAVTQRFLKPTLQFNIGKHFAVSRHCFFDIYAGMAFSWSIYKRLPGESYQPYQSMWGFARRHVDIFQGGARFGMLLWSPARRTGPLD